MDTISSMIPPLKIGRLVARVPIVQGGMGVGVSLSGLASAVANEGGIGVIAGAAIGLVDSPNGARFAENNLSALRREIRMAKEKSPGGVIGVNLMVALTDYAEMCRVAADEGADIIFSGAGLPMSLPAYTQGSDTCLVPIVSSGRAAALLCSSWQKKHSRLPDAFVVEGPKAGGHLGFKRDELDRIDEHPLEGIVKETLDAVEPYQDAAGRPIPVIAAGGVFDGADIARFLKMGAAGVQIATRFVCTYECDASQEFKDAFMQARPESLMYVTSPVGMPGRALRNEWLTRVESGEQIHTTSCPYHCLKTCDPSSRPYCIAIALDQARRGNLERGLVFAGENVSRVDRMLSVRALMAELMEETERALRVDGIQSETETVQCP